MKQLPVPRNLPVDKVRLALPPVPADCKDGKVREVPLKATPRAAAKEFLAILPANDADWHVNGTVICATDALEFVGYVMSNHIVAKVPSLQ